MSQYADRLFAAIQAGWLINIVHYGCQLLGYRQPTIKIPQKTVDGTLRRCREEEAYLTLKWYLWPVLSAELHSVGNSTSRCDES